MNITKKKLAYILKEELRGILFEFSREKELEKLKSTAYQMVDEDPYGAIAIFRDILKVNPEDLEAQVVIKYIEEAIEKGVQVSTYIRVKYPAGRPKKLIKISDTDKEEKTVPQRKVPTAKDEAPEEELAYRGGRRGKKCGNYLYRWIARGRHSVFGIPFDAKINVNFFRALKRAEKSYKSSHPEEYEEYKNYLHLGISELKNKTSIHKRKTQLYSHAGRGTALIFAGWCGKCPPFDGGCTHRDPQGFELDFAYAGPSHKPKHKFNLIPQNFMKHLNSNNIYGSAKDPGHTAHLMYRPESENKDKLRKGSNKYYPKLKEQQETNYMQGQQYMKVIKHQLKQIIKEELQKVLNENAALDVASQFQSKRTYHAARNRAGWALDGTGARAGRTPPAKCLVELSYAAEIIVKKWTEDKLVDNMCDSPRGKNNIPCDLKNWMLKHNACAVKNHGEDVPGQWYWTAEAVIEHWLEKHPHSSESKHQLGYLDYSPPPR